MSRIKEFPIMFFAVIMGFGGLSIAVLKLGFDENIFLALRALSTLLFALICVLYAIKIVAFNAEFKKELNHPIRLNFFAAFSISLLLLAMIYEGSVAAWLFYAGVIAQSYITLFVLRAWVERDINITHSNPAWFIPVVGNLLVPIASPELAPWLWFYFGFGLFFYIALFSVLFYRLIFHPQLPSKFMPTLFIFIAPPSIAFLDFVRLSGFGAFAYILLSVAVFFAVLLVFMWRNFTQLKFFLSWWAFSFPLAALCVALHKASELSGDYSFKLAAYVVFALLCLVVIVNSFFTLRAIVNKQICVAE